MISTLYKKSAVSLLIKCTNVLLTFSLSILLARTLGAQGYGLYTFALAIVMMSAVPAQMGLPQLVVRETARAAGAEEWSTIKGLWRWATLAALVFSCLAVSIALIAIAFFRDSWDSQGYGVLLVGLFLVPLIGLAAVRSASLRGLGAVGYGLLPEGVVKPAALIVGVMAYLSMLEPSASLTAGQAMGLNVASAFLAFIAGAFILRWHIPSEIRRELFRKYKHAEWLNAVIPLALVMGFRQIVSYTDLLMLGIYRSTEEVGVYRAASHLSLLIVFGLQAINQVIQPRVAVLYQQGDIQSLQRLVTKSTRLIFGLALAPVVIMVVWGADLLDMLYGGDFAVGGEALAVLAIGQLVSASVGSVALLLNMTGFERVTLKSIMIAAIINIALNVALIPEYGMLGAAFATAASIMVLNVVLCVLVSRRVGVKAFIMNRGY